MRKVLLWPLLALWSCVVVGSPALDAADKASGAHLLPPETLAVFSVGNVPQFLEQIKNSQTGKMLEEPKLQPVRQEVLSKLREAFAEVERELGVTLADLQALPQGEFTVALVEKPARKLAGVVLFNCGERQDTVDQLLKKMDAALKREGAQFSTQEAGDVAIRVYALSVPNNNPIKTLAYFRHEGYVVFGTEVAALKAIFDLKTGKSDESLAESDVFAYIQKQCSTGTAAPAVQWYLDLVGLVKVGVSMVQGQNPQAGLVLGMLPILGLDKLKGMGGGMDLSVDDFDVVSKMFLYVEQPPTGVLGLFQFPTADLTPPKWVGDDVASYMGFNWNVDEAYLAAESVVDSFQGPGALAKLLESIADGDDGPQVHLKKDLLDQLTGRIDLVSQPQTVTNSEPSVPSMVLALGVKDPARMQRTLAKAAEADRAEMKKRNVNGNTVYEFPMEGPGDVTMSMTVAAEALVLSTDSASLDRMLRGTSRKALADSKDYAKVARHFPKQTSIISFQKADAQWRTAYDMLKQQPNDFLDLSQLPEFEVLQKYMYPSGMYFVPDRKGALMVGFSLNAR